VLRNRVVLGQVPPVGLLGEELVPLPRQEVHNHRQQDKRQQVVAHRTNR
jgi:hypothetical protein